MADISQRIAQRAETLLAMHEAHDMNTAERTVAAAARLDAEQVGGQATDRKDGQGAGK